MPIGGLTGAEPGHEHHISDRPTQDSRKRGALRDILTPDGQNPATRGQHPPGDFVNHTVADGAFFLVEGHYAGGLIHPAGDDLINIDQKGVHRAESGGASGAGHLGGRAAFAFAGGEKVVELGEGLAMQRIKDRTGILRQIGGGFAHRAGLDAFGGKMVMTGHRPEHPQQRVSCGKDQRLGPAR